MTIFLSITVGAVAGAVVAAWRLKGSLSLKQAVTAVIQGGGGAGPRQ